MTMRVARRWWAVAAMLFVPLLLLIFLRVAAHFDAQFFSPHSHLVVVAGIAALALAIALAAVLSARTTHHASLVLVGCGAAGLGILMLGHGLTTPGVLGQPDNPWVGRLPVLAMAVFATGLFLAGLGIDHRLNRWVGRHSSGFVLAMLGVMAVATAVVVFDPTVVAVTAWEEDAFDVLTAVTVGLCLVTMSTHWQRWQLGRDTVQLALVFAAAMTIAAAISLQHGRFGQLSWWDYHAYLLAGFGAAVYAVVHRVGQTREVTEVLGSAFSDDPFEHIVRGYPDALRQLVRAVEIKDAYTHGHSERTARVATQLGIRMGLPPESLRVIARGAYLHDLGKIGIPDHVLNKPDRLTPEERAVIETHPQLGYEIASGAASLAETLGVILHHHERFDGGGYPHGIANTTIPLEARVVTVADVWDALTSDRAYRKGWAPSDALAHIEAGRGTHFDPAVVDAMVQLAAEWGIRPTGSGEPEEAWAAAQTCHQVDPNADLVGA